MNKSLVKFLADFGPLLIFFIIYKKSGNDLSKAIPPLIISTIVAVVIVYFLEKKIPYHVLLNKSDKLNNSEKIATLEECKKALEKIDAKFKINGSCSLFSASKKVGLKELQLKLMEWLIR